MIKSYDMPNYMDHRIEFHTVSTQGNTLLSIALSTNIGATGGQMDKEDYYT